MDGEAEEAVEGEEGRREERGVRAEFEKVFVGEDEAGGEERRGRRGGGREEKRVKHAVTIDEVVRAGRREKRVRAVADVDAAGEGGGKRLKRRWTRSGRKRRERREVVGEDEIRV